MNKALLFTLLIFSVTLNIYFYLRVQNIDEQFNTAINALETKDEYQNMFQGLMMFGNPSRDEILDYFETFYPADSLGPYSSQIVWRDVDFYFHHDSLQMMTAVSSPEWTCGTFSGCETNLRFELPEFLYSPITERINFVLYRFRYAVLTGLFFLFFFLQLKKNPTPGSSKKYFFPFLMLLSGFILTMLNAYEWLDDVMFTDISKSLLVSSWKEIQTQFLLSLILSLTILLNGFVRTRWWERKLASL